MYNVLFVKCTLYFFIYYTVSLPLYSAGIGRSGTFCLVDACLKRVSCTHYNMYMYMCTW